MKVQTPQINDIQYQIKQSLKEDIGDGDVTAAIISEQTIACAEVISREDLVVCGQAWFDSVFATIDTDIKIDWLVAEGDDIAKNSVLVMLKGPARALLTGERTALNWLQTLSATATQAKRYAEALAGTQCRVLDTRKTIPGLRVAQKYAVACGGCSNHRIGLFDGILIKENHIQAAGSIASAVQRARAISQVPVEVEVENLQEYRQALQAAPDRIMLDNFSLQDLTLAVSLKTGAIELEASGNITLEKLQEIAQTGVDFISVGSLTKNIRAIDLSMRIKLLENAEA